MKLLLPHALCIYIFCIHIIVAQHFEGDSYTHNSDPQQKMAVELIAKIDPIEPNYFILDIGCGTGEITRLLSAKVPQGVVIGIDNNKSMITTAKATEAPLNILFHHLAAEQITSENAFHIAFSSNVFHWIKDLRSVIEKIHTALKPSGKGYFLMDTQYENCMLLATEETVTNKDRWRAIFEKNPQGCLKNSIIARSRKEVLSLFSPTFANVLVKKVNTSYSFDTMQKFIGWVQTGPANQVLSPEDFAEYCQEFAQTYAQLTDQDPTGPIVYKETILHITVQK